MRLQRLRVLRLERAQGLQPAENDVVKMAGNAMHVAVLGHVMMYCFASVARRQGASLRCELRFKEENDDRNDELCEFINGK